MPTNPSESDYAQNYEIANIGQIKNLFSWSLNEEFLIMPDRNGDGIPDIFDTQWSEDIGNLRYISVFPVGGNIKIAHDGDVVSLSVKVVDETGRKISNAPLKISVGGVETVGEYNTDANGGFTFSHTASFSGVAENRVDIALSSEKPYSSAKFLVKKAVDSELPERSDVLSQWVTDGKDGSISTITKEKIREITNSTTHTVTNPKGETVHQHQDHIGKYGSVRRFSDKWTGTKTIGNPKLKDHGPTK